MAAPWIQDLVTKKEILGVDLVLLAETFEPEFHLLVEFAYESPKKNFGVTFL